MGEHEGALRDPPHPGVETDHPHDVRPEQSRPRRDWPRRRRTACRVRSSPHSQPCRRETRRRVLRPEPEPELRRRVLRRRCSRCDSSRRVARRGVVAGRRGVRVVGRSSGLGLRLGCGVGCGAGVGRLLLALHLLLGLANSTRFFLLDEVAKFGFGGGTGLLVLDLARSAASGADLTASACCSAAVRWASRSACWSLSSRTARSRSSESAVPVLSVTRLSSLRCRSALTSAESLNMGPKLVDRHP